MLVDGIQESEQVSEFNTDVSAEWKNTMWRNIYYKGHHPFIYHCELKRCLEGYFHFYMLSSFLSVQFRSVAQSCPTRCDLMYYSTPGFPVHHQLLESTQTHVHWVCYAIKSSSVVPFSSCPQSFLASGSFQMSELFTSGGQSIGVSASTSVLPVNIYDWFPLGWTGWISLPSKGLSRVFSNTTGQKHQFFSAHLSL